MSAAVAAGSTALYAYGRTLAAAGDRDGLSSAAAWLLASVPPSLSVPWAACFSLLARETGRAIAAYADLGYVTHAWAEDAALGVRVAFLRGPGPGPWVEIVSPLDESGGPLRSFIRRKQLPSPYHTCYAVEDIATASALLRGQGFLPLGEPRPAAVFQGATIWYHLHDAIGLVELVQRPPF